MDTAPTTATDQELDDARADAWAVARSAATAPAVPAARSAAPTITTIQAALDTYAALPGFREHGPTGGLVDPNTGEVLTAFAVQSAWFTILPDDNDGQISDPVAAVIHGAVCGGTGPWR